MKTWVFALVAPGGLTASQVTTYNNLYNDLLGCISQVNETFCSNLQTYQTAGTPRVRNFILSESGYFFQDDWRVTSKLTLNLGLRWEYSYVNFSGTSADIGSLSKTGNGVYYFTPAQIAEFSSPGAFSYGNTARNQFRNPPFFETDLSLSKAFHITEHHVFSLRCEAYNLFNHANFGFTGSSPTSESANTNITTLSTFGKFSSTLGTQVGGSSARTLQVGARYDF